MGAAVTDHLFTPDALLPSQFAATMRSTTMEPEQALQFAVMVQAAEDLLTTDRAKGQLRAAAEAWVIADDEHWPFSFVLICQAFNLDPDGLRAALFQRVRALREPQQAAGGVG